MSLFGWSLPLTLAFFGLAGGSEVNGIDQRAIAAAVEVFEHRKLTALAAHQEAFAFLDDAGVKLADYLKWPRSPLAPSPTRCKAEDISITPREQIKIEDLPDDVAGEGLRELRMVIRCQDGQPIYTRVTYSGGVLARLKYVVEFD